MRQSIRTRLDRPLDYCAGWAFSVALPAFFDALDIIVVERVYELAFSDGHKERETRPEWSIGNPPAYAFSIGDTFHSPPTLPAPWGEQVKHLFHTIQVLEVGPQSVMPGDKCLIVAVTHHQTGERERVTISQSNLARALQYGWSG